MKFKTNILLAFFLLAMGGCFRDQTDLESKSPFVDTRKEEKLLDSLLVSWHAAASNADIQSYFNLMDSSFIFLGTDSTERWTKDMFHTFCAPYFEQGKAWDFKSTERHWSFNAKGDIAWFSENLTTWMKGCRGSGVWLHTSNGWKIVQYNLAVTVPNESIQGYLKLRREESVGN